MAPVMQAEIAVASGVSRYGFLQRTIRRMLTIQVVDNINAVQVLWKEYWKALGLPSDFQGFEEALQRLPGEYSAPGGTLALAYVEGVPAGTIALRPLSGTACEVKRLYVRPEFRRRGIGRRLMEWIIGRARKLGYRTVHCDTLPTLTGAIEMYRKLGFLLMEHPYSNDPTPGAIYLALQL